MYSWPPIYDTQPQVVSKEVRRTLSRSCVARGGEPSTPVILAQKPLSLVHPRTMHIFPSAVSIRLKRLRASEIPSEGNWAGMLARVGHLAREHFDVSDRGNFGPRPKQ